MFTTAGLSFLISLLILIALVSFAEYRLDLRDSWAKYRTWLALKRKYNLSHVEVSFFEFCFMNTSDKNTALYTWLAANLDESEIASLHKRYSHIGNVVDHRRTNWGLRQPYQTDWILRCLPHQLLVKKAKVG